MNGPFDDDDDDDDLQGGEGGEGHEPPTLAVEVEHHEVEEEDQVEGEDEVKGEDDVKGEDEVVGEGEVKGECEDEKMRELVEADEGGVGEDQLEALVSEPYPNESYEPFIENQMGLPLPPSPPSPLAVDVPKTSSTPLVVQDCARPLRRANHIGDIVTVDDDDDADGLPPQCFLFSLFVMSLKFTMHFF